VIYAWRNPSVENVLQTNKIEVPYAAIDRLTYNWSKMRNRPPTKAEIAGLIDEYIKEEVYYREALALGLDQNDKILRRRLMQKMEFLSNDLAALNVPDESTLNTYFLDNQDKYKLPAEVSFTHIFFSREKRGETVANDAKDILSQLGDKSDVEHGDRFVMGYDFTAQSPYKVEGVFGKAFATALFKTTLNRWHGPIPSSYGLHLVWITKRRDTQLPELSAVIDQLRTDFMFEQQQKINKDVYENLKNRYEIVFEEKPKQSDSAKTNLSGSTSL